MRITISGKNIDVTQGLKDAVYEKLGKLEKYFTPETEAIVTLSVEKNRQKIEVTVPVKGSVIRAEQVSDDSMFLLILCRRFTNVRCVSTKPSGKQKPGRRQLPESIY